MKVRWAKILLTGYVLFLLLLVGTADAGMGGRFWSFVRVIPLGDKVGHFALFGALSFLVNWILFARTWQIGPVSILKGSAVLFAIVFVEELSQLFFATRTFDWLDLLADAIGIFGCGLLARNRLRQLVAHRQRILCAQNGPGG